jgi:hypothetical protein
MNQTALEDIIASNITADRGGPKQRRDFHEVRSRSRDNDKLQRPL